jgi:hypothetical protein
MVRAMSEHDREDAAGRAYHRPVTVPHASAPRPPDQKVVIADHMDPRRAPTQQALRRVTPADAAAYLAELRAKGAAPPTASDDFEDRRLVWIVVSICLAIAAVGGVVALALVLRR